MQKHALNKHFFEHPLATVCYYSFGKGEQVMLCFHGLGMHGKQFYCLSDELGEEFTFYGFDLFFHQDTELVDNSLETIRKGLPPEKFAKLVHDFCAALAIDKFSVIAYSMGTLYAATIIDHLATRVQQAFLIAPSFLRIKPIVTFLSANTIGNFLFRKLALSKNGLLNLLRLMRTTRILDYNSTEILWREIATPELRFKMYANITYLNLLQVNKRQLAQKTNTHDIPLYFIFGKNDKTVRPTLTKYVNRYFPRAKVLVLEQNHDLVNTGLTRKILFCTP